MKPKLATTAHFELFVMTHIDADHIEGAMPLVKLAESPFDAKQIWFNGYHHLIAAKTRQPQHYETFSANQGEKLSDGIRKFGWQDRWNAAFGGGPVSTDNVQTKEAIKLAGDLSLQLLSPSDLELSALEKSWRAEIEKMGLLPGQPDRVESDVAGREKFGIPNVDRLADEPFVEDRAAPNGSSIAFIAEFGQKRILLAGDAHPGRLEASLRRRGWNEQNRLTLECLKLSHHGSKANTSPSLLRIIDCTRFAFSTDGTRHDHPDPQTIARILSNEADRPKELIFNFRQPNAMVWDIGSLKKRWNYSCTFPPDGEEGVTIVL
jgi:hypothetical protein